MVGSIVQSFENLTSFLKPGGRVCIVVESPTSDLNAARQVAFSLLYHMEAVSPAAIEETLRGVEDSACRGVFAVVWRNCRDCNSLPSL